VPAAVTGAVTLAGKLAEGSYELVLTATAIGTALHTITCRLWIDNGILKLDAL
jgi:hypothetical protein